MEKVAAEMDKGGIRKGHRVIIGLPNANRTYRFSLAAWHLGACCIPVSCSLKEFEQDRVLGLVPPADCGGLDFAWGASMAATQRRHPEIV